MASYTVQGVLKSKFGSPRYRGTASVSPTLRAVTAYNRAKLRCCPQKSTAVVQTWLKGRLPAVLRPLSWQ